MLSQLYLIRSKADGSYLAAHPTDEANYLLMFREKFEALSYLNTHGQGVADRFAVESIPGTQLKALLQRWGFSGVGLVQDPLIPQIQFMTYQ
ncbi:MAG: hypothetical protein ACFB4I_09730 [Cyanophyceae cyanobacterium]